MGSSCCGMSDNENEDRQPINETSQVRSSSEATVSQSTAHTVPQRSNRYARNRQPTQYQPITASIQSTGRSSSQHLEQQRLAQRQRLIDQLPCERYEESLKRAYTECPICIVDFEKEHEVKSLPCKHLFHKECIDDWLMRNLRCPSCMEPVDAALVSQFDHFASI
ncbi:RING finger protein 11-like isoform X2 [Watersipora subatra]|uniref:RING finger protein 11-like isoform X2 n=1 Tax=Watersipora subatra TaxID=2589382 RepID=UPI00355C2768